MIKIHILRVAAIWLLVFSAHTVFAQTTNVARGSDSYILAVLPSAPPVPTHTLWTPLVERLSRDTGLEFRLKVYETMSAFELDILRGSPDFLFSSSLQFIVAHQALGYAPLVRGSKLISAGIFTRKDSPIRTVDDLAGKKIAFVGGKSL